MLNFVAKVFRGWVTFILWLLIIGLGIIGAIVGNILGGGGVTFLFLLVGAFVGFIIAILFGGFIANFLNMVDNIEAIKLHLTKTGNTSGGSSSTNPAVIRSSGNLDLSKVSPITPINANYVDTWTCKKCGERNRLTSPTCRECGEYK